MTNSSSRSVLKGAFILSLAGLISKIISAGYRVPLQNLTGDLGFYIYQQVYPILGIGLILALYGFPAAISKLVSELELNHTPISIPSFYLPVFIWLMGACLSIFLLGYTQAPWLAAIMNDDRLIPSLRAAFAAFLVIPFVSIFRGVFQGKNEMAPTAVSQIIEQILRVGMIIITAFAVMKGKDVYSIGLGASAGSILGGCGAALLLFVWIKKNKPLWTVDKWQRSISYPKTIFLYGLLICLNYMLLLSLQLVDALTLVPELIKTGYEIDAARIMKGVFDRGQPLIQLGTILASSIALAIIPSVTKKRMRQNPEQVEGAILSAVKITAMIAFGATAGLIFLFPSINQVFFQGTQGTGSLRLLMMVIVGSSISITTSSVLQGLGYVKHTAFVVVGGMIVKGAGNLFLVLWFDLYGAAISSIIAVTFVLVGNIVILRHEIPFYKWLALPWLSIILSLTGMVAALYVINSLMQLFTYPDHRLVLLIPVLILTGVGACIYLGLLLKFGSFSKDEVQTLPSHKWLMKLLPKGMKQ